MTAQSVILTDEEIAELTGYNQRKRQIKALKSMGIPVLLRPRDGKPVVLRSALQTEPETELNLGAL